VENTLLPVAGRELKIILTQNTGFGADGGTSVLRGMRTAAARAN